MNSLGTRLAIVISLILLVMVVTAGLLVQHQLRDTITEQSVEQAEIHAQTILGSLKTLMLNGNGTLARQWLDRLQGVAGIKEIEVYRRDGSVAFTDLNTVNSVNEYLGSPRFTRNPVAPQVPPVAPSEKWFERALAGDTIHDTSVTGQVTVTTPINTAVECLACHGYDQMQMRGVLKLSLSTESIQSRIDKMRDFLWAGTCVMVGILAIALWLSIRLNVLMPLARIRDGIMRVSEGDRTARVSAVHQDELGELAAVFNRMQDALNNSLVRTRAVMDNVVDGVLTLTDDGVIEMVNPAVERIFGYRASELIGHPVTKLAPTNHADGDEFILGAKSSQQSVLGLVREVNARRSNGTVFPIDVAVSQMTQADNRYYIAVIRDITSRKARTAALRYQALHDALTDLPNRTLLFDRLQQALRSSQRTEQTLSLILMDLDRFKEVNDTLGHHVGDKLLQQVAKRLRALLRQSDTVARLGGDEFSVLLPDTSEEQAMVIARKIVSAIDEPIIVEGQRLSVGISLGLALYPDHGDSAGVLMQRADVAMYLAKRNNVSIAVYDPERDPHSLRQLAISSELRYAIEHDQLLLHYQPKLNLATGELGGVEALVRWQHPKHGLLSPDEFVHLAEQSGLIRPLTLWVLERALVDCMTCVAGMHEVRLSVNLSMRNLQDNKFADEVAQIMARFHVPASTVRMEITETALMEEPEQAVRALEKLSTMGISLAIDDFGTGYSSLSYLKKLPVTELKIDKSFGLSLVTDANSVLIVRSTIDLAHKLGMNVVAEGVESADACELLQKLGCDAVQGFYLAKPMPKEEMAIWMKQHFEKQSRVDESSTQGESTKAAVESDIE